VDIRPASVHDRRERARPDPAHRRRGTPPVQPLRPVTRPRAFHQQWSDWRRYRQAGDSALVLVDGNGDGAELELEYWHRDTDGTWEGGATSGHGALTWLPSSDAWSTGELVCALGRGDPASLVSISYGGTTYSRQTNEFGLWGFLHDADSARPDDLPTVTARRS
jgi:hypothetical protein